MIDFHCHIDLFPDPYKAAHEIRKTGAYVLSVTTTPKAFPKTSQLSKGSSRIRTALGLHPQLALERKNELSLFEHLIGETNYVGEVGLDGGRDFRSSAHTQKEVFSQILQFCENRGGRIISIHSRHAATEVLYHLRQKPSCGTPVLHWFSGTNEELDQAISQGCWFSVGLPMTRSQKGQAILAKLPRNRVLTETDAPFAGSSIVPALHSVQKKFAEIWSVTEEEAELMLHNNLKRLLARQ